MSEPNTRELAFLRAASVLWQFSPDLLQPDEERPAASGEALDLLASHVVRLRRGSRQREQWTLRDALRPALLRGRDARELARLRTINSAIDSFEQELVDRWCAGPDPELGRYNLERLAVVSRVCTWFYPLPDHFPSADALAELRAQARFREPLRALVASGLRGRARELDALRDFVFGPNPPPSMVVHGIGGIGKSTLAAWFLTSLADAGDRSHVLAYIDFDNPTVSISDGLTVVAEILSQAAAQRPDVTSLSVLVDRAAQATIDLAAARGRGPGRSLAARASVEELAHAAGEVLYCAGVSRVTVVLDTFEEMQFGSVEHQRHLDEHLAILKPHLPDVRAIVVSRANLSVANFAHLEIGDLDAEAACAFLSDREVTDPKDVATVLDVAGGNPLSLNLAAVVLRRAGAKALSDIGRREAVQQELIQGQLYRRILEHLHSDDVQALAHPGLVVRRVTPDILQKVLAEPCGVDVPTTERAEELFRQLGREVSLVRLAPDGALEHRPDVRRVMLPLLYRDQPVRSREIHERAGTYYSRRADEIAIVEEAYHRLAVGETAGPWLDRLTPPAWARIGAVLEELPRGSWPLVASYAKVDLPKEQWEGALAVDRERRLAGRVEELLRGDRVEEAALLLDENPPAGDQSILWRWQGRAFRLAGRLAEALHAFEQSAATLLGPPEEADKDRHLALEVAMKLGDADRAARFLPKETATASLPTRVDVTALEGPPSHRPEENEFRWLDDEDLRKLVQAVIEAPKSGEVVGKLEPWLSSKLEPTPSRREPIAIEPGTLEVEPRISGKLESIGVVLKGPFVEPRAPLKLEAVFTGGSTRAATAYATAMSLNRMPRAGDGTVPLLDWINGLWKASTSTDVVHSSIEGQPTKKGR